MRMLQAVPATLGAAATVLLTLPVRPLFEDDAWVADAVLGVLVVLLSGLALRWLTSRAVLVVGGQALASGGYLLHTYVGETTTFGLPTAATIGAVGDLVTDAQQTITEYAAPAPLTPGVAAMLGGIVVLVALAVDLAAATADSPAIAGLPLFSLFLVSTANSDDGLHWGWFVAAALLWLAMLGYQARDSTERWTTVVAGERGGQDADSAHRMLGRQAMQVGVLALAAAVVLPALLPHLPQRYLLDGLGRGGVGGGPGETVRLSTELDLRRSLRSPSTEPVLTYRTDDPTPEPLRVAVVDQIADGRVRMSEPGPQPPGGLEGDPRPEADQDVPRRERKMSVLENGVAAPQLPVPAGLDVLDLGGTSYTVDAAGTVTVTEAPDEYTAVTQEIEPTEEDFPPSLEGAGPRSGADLLALDPASQQAVRELTGQVVSEGAGPLQAARQIQAHLRSSAYTYNLELEPAEDGEDAVLHFLRTRTGYCQQFATTMALMARARGIPARVGVGFLPGTSEGDERIVRASDAHAWPELWFDGVGWVRFEPTPGSDAASTPGYSLPGVDEADGSSGSSEETSSTSTSASSSAAPSAQEDIAAGATDGAPTDDTAPWWRWPLVLLLGLVLALAVLPVTAILVRRRRPEDDAARVEQEWQGLVVRLGDLGMSPPDGATPRQTGAWVQRRVPGDPAATDQVDRVVTTLERARYAPDPAVLPDIGDDVDAILGRARRSRTTGRRARALLWPVEGRRAWSDGWRRLTDRLPFAGR
ncbi:transglutaminase-like putative cysteine protease [Janibacter alkaliphilus]|uniref:Transglutaminase-like putative cysteine protease n=2 Tax=Janibacter alkaliphilus TaxID=1069963 RepID=A0A852XAG4_9MICO|nr:transglutaminase-like putative cysteine protease [Janibacter alkaliphilus]